MTHTYDWFGYVSSYPHRYVVTYYLISMIARLATRLTLGPSLTRHCFSSHHLDSLPPESIGTTGCVFLGT